MANDDVIGSKVSVNLFDGHVKNEPGTVFGAGTNSKGETVYLVEMANQDPPDAGTFVGTQQIAHGKCWVLSCYADELEFSEKARRAAE
jgi:hypothetical protein